MNKKGIKDTDILDLIKIALLVILGYIIAKTGGIIAAANGYALLQPAFPIWLIFG